MKNKDIPNKEAMNTSKKAEKASKRPSKAAAWIFSLLAGTGFGLAANNAKADSLQERLNHHAVQHERNDPQTGQNIYKMHNPQDTVLGLDNDEERKSKELRAKYGTSNVKNAMHMWYLLSRKAPIRIKLEKGENMWDAIDYFVDETFEARRWKDRGARKKNADKAATAKAEELGLSDTYNTRVEDAGFYTFDGPVAEALWQGFIGQLPEVAEAVPAVKAEPAPAAKKVPAKPECDDGIDNDGDGLTDLEDVDCKGNRFNKESYAEGPAEGEGILDASKEAEVPLIEVCDADDLNSELTGIVNSCNKMVDKDVSPEDMRLARDKMFNTVEEKYSSCDTIDSDIEAAKEATETYLAHAECRPERLKSSLNSNLAEVLKQYEEGKAGETKEKMDSLKKEMIAKCPPDKIQLIGKIAEGYHKKLSKQVCDSEEFDKELDGLNALTVMDGFKGATPIAADNEGMVVAEADVKIAALESKEYVTECPGNADKFNNAKSAIIDASAQQMCTGSYVDENIEKERKLYETRMAGGEDLNDITEASEARLNSLAADCDLYAQKMTDADKKEEFLNANKGKIDAAKQTLSDRIAAEQKAEREKMRVAVSADGKVTSESGEFSEEGTQGIGSLHARVSNSAASEFPFDFSAYAEGGKDIARLGMTGDHVGAVLEGQLGDGYEFRITWNDSWPGSSEPNSATAVHDQHLSVEGSAKIGPVRVIGGAGYRFNQNNTDVAEVASEQEDFDDLEQVMPGMFAHASGTAYADSDLISNLKTKTEEVRANLGAEVDVTDNWSVCGLVNLGYAQAENKGWLSGTERTRVRGSIEFVDSDGNPVDPNASPIPIDEDSTRVIGERLDIANSYVFTANPWLLAKYDSENLALRFGIGVPNNWENGEGDVDNAFPVDWNATAMLNTKNYAWGGNVSRVGDNVNINLYFANDTEFRDLMRNIDRAEHLRLFGLGNGNLLQNYLASQHNMLGVQESRGWLTHLEATAALHEDADTKGSLEADIMTPWMGPVRFRALVGADFRDNTEVTAGGSALFRLGDNLVLSTTVKGDYLNTDDNSLTLGVNVMYLSD